MATRQAMNQPFAQFESVWKDFLQGMEQSLDQAEKEIDQAATMQNVCTDEWCEATEHYLDDIANAVFSISEPRYNEDPALSKRLKELKKRVHDLYAKYKSAAA
ncbi:hypothetical protein [Oceanidesulfovibrio marinus]|nr:hypothetical protein [Oceanidesulfovibrio marinus]